MKANLDFRDDWVAFLDTPMEMVKGFCVGIVACFAWGAWGISVAVVCAILWRLGGIGFMDTNSWRRVGVPIALSLTFFLESHHWWNFLAIPTMALAMSIGYGIPDDDPYGDKGSWLGRKLVKHQNWIQPVWFAILAVASIPLYL
jgi:hypothetical protein